MEIIMPKMGESITEGTVIKWYKNIGDFVKKDEILFEISTDKVDTEIPSNGEGYLTEILVKENETVDVDTVVAVISETANVSASPGTGNEAAEEPAESVKLSTINKEVMDTDYVEITMPKMGESIMEGTVIKWHKRVGDLIKKDEVIFEISTDKVDSEIPSPVEGYLTEIFVKEQETVDVGAIVAKISTKNKPAEGKDDNVEQPAKVLIPEPETAHSNFSSIIETESRDENSKNRFYSPSVMRIARDNNIELSELEFIKGTGSNSRVTRGDILTYLENRKNVSGQSNVVTSGRDVITKNEAREKQPDKSQEQRISKEGIDVIPMDNIRQKIMHHMLNSKDTSVHVTAMIEVDINKIYNYLKKNKESIKAKEGVKLTYMAFVSNAVVKALKEYPLVNASIEGTNILIKKYINLGIAVALESNGLIVPNIKNADNKNILGLAKAIKEVADKARNKKLIPDDISDGTFTITNYGLYGSIFGTPIINQPESAILGVGAIIKRPVVIEVEEEEIIAIRPIMTITLSHDHRLIDGMLGGKFLKYIKDTLENFDTKNM